MARAAGRWAVWVCVAAGALWGGGEAQAAKKWREYTGCQLRESGGNDGDSFHVEIGSLKSATARHKLFRLYFVDTPESETSLPERLEDQRKYWDLPDAQTVVKCGKMASKFTKDYLGKRPFIAFSKLQDAMGRSKLDRDYAMISLDGTEKTDLGYLLVRNGLARPTTTPVDLSDLEGYERNAKSWMQRLKVAEAEAKRERLGCWAYSSQGGVGGVGARAGSSRLPLPVAPSAPGPGAAPAPVGAPVTPVLPPTRTTPPRPVAPVAAPGGGGAGSLTAATEARIAAMNAPREVAPQDVTLTRSILIYRADDPAQPRPMGQLRGGMTVHVTRGLSPHLAEVTFTTSNGTKYTGAARFSDLGL